MKGGEKCECNLSPCTPCCLLISRLQTRVLAHRGRHVPLTLISLGDYSIMSLIYIILSMGSGPPSSALTPRWSSHWLWHIIIWDTVALQLMRLMFCCKKVMEPMLGGITQRIVSFSRILTPCWGNTNTESVYGLQQKQLQCHCISYFTRKLKIHSCSKLMDRFWWNFVNRGNNYKNHH